MFPFSFKTKAQNLIQLQPFVTKASILDSYCFTVKEWTADSANILQRILVKFPNQKLIVRSSSLVEDTFESSFAGQFDSILNVEPDISHLNRAVEEVIGSYRKFSNDISHFELLIQPMLRDVACSGVLFSRVLETSAPYYVINYDDSTALTDSVTSGAYEAQKNVMIYKKADRKPAKWKALLEAVSELEELCNCDYLDIEFAIDAFEQIYILQVRPIVLKVIRHHGWMDQQVDRQLAEMQAFLMSKIRRKPGVYGENTMFGQMPDWNPAEIIGTRPKPLAYSLYRYVIMESAWREGRQLLGYHTPISSGLMVQIGGRPYVDVRASFNSLLPSGLTDNLAEKLVNYYLSRLQQNPQYHDKIEFEIVHSCIDFSFDRTEDRMKQHGFTLDEIRQFQTALLRLTNKIVLDPDHTLQELSHRVDQLESRRMEWEYYAHNPTDMLLAVDALLKDCITFGTIPFSALARCAFIGTQILRSMVAVGIWTEEEMNAFMNTVDTVASQYSRDMEAFSDGMLSLDTMCRKYGHLRPGTYDITTPRYDEQPDIYFKPVKFRAEKSVSDSFQFTEDQIYKINNWLQKTGFEFNADKLIAFVRESISQRERIKFEFTKNLSLALKYIGRFGEYYGFTLEDMAYIPIEHLLKWNQETLPDSFVDQCRHWIDEQKFVYSQQTQLIVPDLILGPDCMHVVQLIRTVPNFTSTKKVTGEAVCLDHVHNDSALQLEGKIVLIEQADPGYEWLFSRNIAGLITKYGGVASHMAVRCAEFGIPAAIGCGEWLYQQLQDSAYIELNCQEKRVAPCEGFL